MPRARITSDSPPKGDRSRIGALAEKLAADFLTRQGAIILARNFRVGSGEIDLLAIIDGEQAVVEVRAVTSPVSGAVTGPLAPHPLDAFDTAKAIQVRKLARGLQCHRVDLVAVRLHPGGVELHWVKRVA
ncbi:MAG TPA: YraN family protein [Acidimicrobiia bacterium]|nr:YraN family protein [Acidimicrobiia bacterium]